MPLPEEFPTPEEYEKAAADHVKSMEKFTAKREEEIRARLDSGEMPPGVIGLIPDGSTLVRWRWTGEVFEESTDDILNNSIVVRNLQELGVDSIEALKYLFPGKTDEERAAMLSGYPFRMVQQTQQSLNQFIGLLGNLYQIPHPQTPELPLASDPNLDITGFLYRSLEFLRKELSYSGRYKPSGGSDAPSTLSDADQLRAERGQSTRDEPTPSLPGLSGPGSANASGSPFGPGSAGFGTGSEPLAGGVPGAQRKPEYKQPVPGPGVTLGLPDTDTPGSFTGQLPLTANSGSPDLRAPSFNPGLLGSGLPARPTAGGSSGPKRGGSKRRVSKRDQ